MKWPAQRWELAAQVVAHHEGSIALVCPIFGISATCFRYRLLLAAEKDRTADLLVGLHGRWGVSLCFLYLPNEQDMSGIISGFIGSCSSQYGLVHGLHGGQTFGWPRFSSPDHSGLLQS